MEGGKSKSGMDPSSIAMELRDIKCDNSLLGNAAKRLRARIVWDAENLKITNLPEANKYVRTEYRKGWEL